MKEEEKTLLSNPPQKVALMYQAVIDLVNDNVNLNTIKVIDITKRAGIGKGTAYEYFSSKEEIITKALMYDTLTRVEEVVEITENEKTFEGKIKGVLDYMEQHFCENRSFCQLFKIGMGAYDVADRFYQEFLKIQDIVNCQQLEKIEDSIMESAAKEGLIKETNIMKRRMTLCAQVISFSLLLLTKQQKQQDDLSIEMGKQFVYESIIKALN